MPKFGEDLNNVTVPVGREAIFVCNVEGLATYKVLNLLNILVRNEFIKLKIY